MTRAILRYAALAAVAALLGACGLQPGKLFSSHTSIEVREVSRSLYCNSPGEETMVQLLPDAQAVLDWQAARGVSLAGAESIAQATYALVEMGSRPTGGFGLAVARSAVLRGERLVLQATFVSPAPGSLRTQAISSPCVLVQLPRGRYRDVEVQDQTGAVRARGGTLAPVPVPTPTPTPTPEPAAPEPATPAAEPQPETPPAR